MDKATPTPPAKAHDNDAATEGKVFGNTPRGLLQVAAYPVAAAAAYFAAKIHMRANIFKNFSHSGAFDGILKEYDKEYRGILDAVKNNPNLRGPEEIARINKKYRVVIDHALEERKFNHTLRDYWKGLRPNQQAQTIGFAAGAFGVVLTTLLAVADSKSLLARLGLSDQTKDTHSR